MGKFTWFEGRLEDEIVKVENETDEEKLDDSYQFIKTCLFEDDEFGVADIAALDYILEDTETYPKLADAYREMLRYIQEEM